MTGMRDQRELALKCLEVEDAGGSVIEFLKGLGFISAPATWQRLQLNELGRLPSRLNDEKEKTIMGKLTVENKKHAVQLALDGKNPLEYIRSCGVKNAAEAWGKIKRTVQETDPDTFEKIPKRLPLPKKEKEAILTGAAEGMKSAAEAVRDMKDAAEDFFGKCRDMGLKVGATEEPKITRPVNYDGMTVRAVEGDFGSYHFQEINGKQWIDYDDKELANQLSMTVEQWRGFLKEICHAAAILGVEL